MRMMMTRMGVTSPGSSNERDNILATASAQTLEYITAGESADGQQLENAVLQAIVTFANYRIPLGGSCCLLSGWRTLTAALIPMVGAAPTAVNFVSGDYNRSRLLGDGVGKYINSNRAGNADGQDDFHSYTYARGGNYATAAGSIIGSGNNGTGSTVLTDQGCRNRSSSAQSFTSVVGSRGFLGVSRNNSANYDLLRLNDVISNRTSSSQSPDADNFGIFARIDAGSPAFYSASSIAICSIGPNIDLVAARAACIAYDDALTAAGL